MSSGSPAGLLRRRRAAKLGLDKPRRVVPPPGSSAASPSAAPISKYAVRVGRAMLLAWGFRVSESRKNRWLRAPATKSRLRTQQC